MARIMFGASEEFEIQLSRLKTDIDEIAEAAIFAGAEIMADQIKNNLEMSLSLHTTGGLVDSFGVTPIKKTGAGWSAKIGFDGYDDHPNKKYPKGIPYQLIARALESGTSTSTRDPQPFVKPAISKTRKQVEAKMNQIIMERTKEIFGN